MTPLQRLTEFHDAFRERDEPVQTRPRADNVPSKFVALRHKLIREEADEVLEALSEPQIDLAHLAKELSDLVTVVYGTAVLFGIDLDSAFEEVHASNMSKRGPNGEIEFRADGKILKGPFYRAPDMERAIFPSMEVLWSDDGRTDLQEVLVDGAFRPGGLVRARMGGKWRRALFESVESNPPTLRRMA